MRKLGRTEKIIELSGASKTLTARKDMQIKVRAVESTFLRCEKNN